MEYQLIVPEFSYDSMIEQILTNRGIKVSDIKHYLETSDDDILDPTLIANIREGAKMLISHITQDDKVLIQIDSDCDGYTSAAVLINYLNCLFPGFVQNNLLYRIHEGKQHGIITDTIPKDMKLVIAPDSSSSDYEEHRHLKERLGIDVLVIDHHEADKISEYACVINNQLCDYPTKSLSGVGMVYKFCSYIDELMNVDYANLFLDLVALGLVADMMDMRDFETKHLVVQGLQRIRNPYFKGMVAKNAYSLGDKLTPLGIAFYVAPYINATIRVGEQDEKLMLFESMLDHLGYEQIPSTKRGCKGQVETRVEQACRNCTNIKNKQAKARDASLSTIERVIEEKQLLNNKLLVVKLEEFATDKNLTGLIANQLMSKYQRPVLLLNKVIKTIENEDRSVTTWISWEGSGRGYDKSKFDNLREFLQQSNLVEYANGHPNAMGVGIRDDNFDKFIEYSNRELAEFNFTPCYKVDFIFQGDNFKGSDIIEVAELKSIWGQGVGEPYICIEDIKVSKSNLYLMSQDKNPTLKINLSHSGTSLIKFRSSGEEYDSLYSELGCVTMNIVGRCERNIWNGTVSPQIIIEDYEIVGRTEYYF